MRYAVLIDVSGSNHALERRAKTQGQSVVWHSDLLSLSKTKLIINQFVLAFRNNLHKIFDLY